MDRKRRGAVGKVFEEKEKKIDARRGENCGKENKRQGERRAQAGTKIDMGRLWAGDMDSQCVKRYGA